MKSSSPSHQTSPGPLRFNASLVFAACFGLVCSIVSLALSEWGPPRIAEAINPLLIPPYILTVLVGWFVRFPLGGGILLLIFFVFLQWFVVGLALAFMFRLTLLLVRAVLPRRVLTIKE